MEFSWFKLLRNTAFWLFSEIMLTVLGLDDLADYSEYLLHRFEQMNTAPVVFIAKGSTAI